MKERARALKLPSDAVRGLKGSEDPTDSKGVPRPLQERECFARSSPTEGSAIPIRVGLMIASTEDQAMTASQVNQFGNRDENERTHQA